MTTDQKAVAYTARIANQSGKFSKGEIETAFVAGYDEALSTIREYKKPEILAQSKGSVISCRPNSKPSGSPCNPPKPGGR